MEKQSLGGVGFERATGSGRAYHLRGRSGFLGQSTRSGHYGFFRGGSGVKPSPGFFDPFTPQPDYHSPMPKRKFRFGGPLKTDYGAFGRRRNTFGTSGMATRAARNSALKMLGRAALRGLAYSEGLGVAFDVATLFYGGMGGGTGDRENGPVHFRPGWTCEYTCATPLPYILGTAFRNIGSVSCPIPWYLRCTGGQVPYVYPGYGSIDDWQIGPDGYTFMYGPYRPIGPNPRFQIHHVVTYKKPVPPSLYGKPPIEWKPYYYPAPDPFPEPFYNPFVPMAKPILRLSPFPPPMPYALANSPSPDVESGAGYGGYGPPRSRGSSGSMRNAPLPSFTGPPAHEVRPPRAKEKEGKHPVRQGTFVKFVKAAYGKYTEFGDAVNDFYKAMGKDQRNADFRENGYKPLSDFQKARSLYQNWDKVDYAQGVGNFILDQAQDAVIGRANKAANRITKNPYWKRPVGLGAGNRYHPTNFARYYLM